MRVFNLNLFKFVYFNVQLSNIELVLTYFPTFVFNRIEWDFNGKV